MADSTGDETAADTETLAGELEWLRAEMETLREENEQLRGQTAAPSGRGWRRRWLSVTCAVLAGVLLPVAVITVWARNTMLDTNEYVATVAPLAENEDIQEAVSFRVTEAVAEAADFRSIAEEALPEEAQLLAGPIESGAKSLIGELVGTIVATEQFANLWEQTNRAAHENLVPLLKGEDSDLVGTSEGRVALKLGPLAEDTVARLDETLGTNLADQIPAEQLDTEIVLIDSSELADVQTQVAWFDALSWFSLILALLLLIGAVLFAEQRRLGARRLGLAVVIPMLVALLAYAWLRDQYIGGLPDDVHNPDAAAAIFDILTVFLQRAFRTLLVIGILVLIGAWVTGPSAGAVRARTWWDTLLGRAGDAGADREVGPVLRSIAAHERALLIGAGSLGALALVLWNRPTGLNILFLALVTLLVLAAIRLLAAVARRSEESPPDPREPDDEAGKPTVPETEEPTPSL